MLLRIVVEAFKCRFLPLLSRISRGSRTRGNSDHSFRFYFDIKTENAPSANCLRDINFGDL